jgi:hypothetical protein
MKDGMKSTIPRPDLLDDDLDAELILTFLTKFQLLEQALVRAGFTRPGRIHGNAQADWLRFVRRIEPRFRPDSSPELQGAVSFLLYDPEKHALRQKRLQDYVPGETFSANSDILWLLELVLETGNKLTYGLPFLKKTDLGSDQIMAALFVVEAWSDCDPVIESLLTSGQ